MQDDHKDGDVLFKKEIVIRPATSLRSAIKIIITQVITEENEIAMASAVVTGIKSPWHLEKPDIMIDLSVRIIQAAGIVEELNRKVKKNGKG